jgi:hypothetical protein
MFILDYAVGVRLGKVLQTVLFRAFLTGSQGLLNFQSEEMRSMVWKESIQAISEIFLLAGDLISR